LSLSDDPRQWAAPSPSLSPAELADRLAVSQLVKIYALGIDMRDYDLARSAFAAEAFAEGSQVAAPIDEYLPSVYKGAAAYAATQHNVTNQHVTIDGDEALVWSYAVAYHKGAAGSAREFHLTVGVQYRDRCRRFANGWLITARKVATQWTEKTAIA
jgi:hypothetical protein